MTYNIFSALRKIVNVDVNDPKNQPVIGFLVKETVGEVILTNQDGKEYILHQENDGYVRLEEVNPEPVSDEESFSPGVTDFFNTYGSPMAW